MNNIKLSLTVLALIIFGFDNLKAQDTLTLSLEQCRNMALENSEEVKIASQNITKVQGEKIAAKAAWFPNVSVSALGLYSKQEIEQEIYFPTQVFDQTTGELVPNVAINSESGEVILDADGNAVFNTYGYLPLDLSLNGGATAGIAVEQPLYAGGKIIAGNKMARVGEKMAFANKELKQAELIFQTDQLYYQYLSVKEKVKLAQEYKKLLNELVTTVKNSFELGMTNRNELLKVQVKLNEAVLQVQKAETGLVLSQMALCRIVGLDLYTSIYIDDSISNIEFLLDSIHGLNVDNRIEFQLLKDRVELAGQNVNMVKGDFKPSAGISLGYNYLKISLNDMDDYNKNGFSAMASIKIPITTFGERKGKVMSAEADYQVKQLELKQNKEYLQLEIEQARLNYVNAFDQVEMTRISLEQATENMRICDDNYKLGMETIVNLLEAKAEWQKAYSNRIDALTGLKVNESNLLRVSNKLK